MFKKKIISVFCLIFCLIFTFNSVVGSATSFDDTTFIMPKNFDYDDLSNNLDYYNAVYRSGNDYYLPNLLIGENLLYDDLFGKYYISAVVDAVSQFEEAYPDYEYSNLMIVQYDSSFHLFFLQDGVMTFAQHSGWGDYVYFNYSTSYIRCQLYFNTSSGYSVKFYSTSISYPYRAVDKIIYLENDIVNPYNSDLIMIKGSEEKIDAGYSNMEYVPASPADSNWYDRLKEWASDASLFSLFDGFSILSEGVKNVIDNIKVLISNLNLSVLLTPINLMYNLLSKLYTTITDGFSDMIFALTGLELDLSFEGVFDVLLAPLNIIKDFVLDLISYEDSSLINFILLPLRTIVSFIDSLSDFENSSLIDYMLLPIRTILTLVTAIKDTITEKIIDVINAVVSVPGNIISELKLLILPSDEYLTYFYSEVGLYFELIDKVTSFGDELIKLIEDIKAVSPELVIPSFEAFGTTILSYTIDFSWYEEIRFTMNITFLGFLYGTFIVNFIRHLPRMIKGY